MHGKAQREPAWHSVILDCKLVPLHHVPKFACCLLYNVHVVRLAVCQCENLGGGQKLANCSQPFLDKVHQIWGHVGRKCPGVQTKFFKIAITSVYVSSLVEISSVTSEIRHQKNHRSKNISPLASQCRAG